MSARSVARLCKSTRSEEHLCNILSPSRLGTSALHCSKLSMSLLVGLRTKDMAGMITLSREIWADLAVYTQIVTPHIPIRPAMSSIMTLPVLSVWHQGVPIVQDSTSCNVSGEPTRIQATNMPLATQ